MRVRDFLADRQIRANRREADEPMAVLAETVIMALAVVATVAWVFA
jgi:hypothetical protein